MGAVAGIINNACTIPFDVVATNHQVSGLDRKNKETGEADTSIFTTAKEVWRKGGLSAFWGGMAPSCMLVINPAINFAAFDRLKLVYNRTFKSGGGKRRLSSAEAAAMSLGPLEAFFLGAASKAIATSITFPLIRAKVLMMQADNKKKKKKTKTKTTRKGGGTSGAGGGTGGRKGAPAEEEEEEEDMKRQGMAFVEMLRDAINAEGIGGLYKGLGVQLSRSAVAAAIMFMTREQLDALTAGTLRRLKKAAITTVA